MPLTIYTEGVKGVDTHVKVYVTCMVIRVWSSSHPVTLEPSPSRP